MHLMKIDYNHPVRKVLFILSFAFGFVILALFTILAYSYSEQAIITLEEGLSETGKVLLNDMIMAFIASYFSLSIVVSYYFSLFTSGIIDKPFDTQIHSSKVFHNTSKWMDKNKKCRNGLLFREANDEYLVIVNDHKRIWLWVFGIVFIICLLGMLKNIFDSGKFLIAKVDFYLLGMILSLILFVRMRFRKDRKIIFDRMNGVVHFPPILLRSTQPVPLEKTYSPPERGIGKWGYKRDGFLTVMHPINYAGSIIPQLESHFYAWYMDRNRPLPNCELFDKYHEKDFKRRQAEGFPDPLYPSEWAITDDRYGYLYGTEDFLKKATPYRMNIEKYYHKVYLYILNRQPEKELKNKDKDIVLIGIWQDYFLFRLGVQHNQLLYIFDNKEECHDCYLTGMENEITFYMK